MDSETLILVVKGLAPLGIMLLGSAALLFSIEYYIRSVENRNK